MKRFTLLAMGLLTFSGAAAAQEAELRGVGAASCGQFLQSNNNDNVAMKVAYQQWAQGYLGGVSDVFLARDQKVFVVPDAAAMDQWLVNYCTAHPLETYLTALRGLFVEISKNGTWHDRSQGNAK